MSKRHRRETEAGAGEEGREGRFGAEEGRVGFEGEEGSKEGRLTHTERSEEHTSELQSPM